MIWYQISRPFAFSKIENSDLSRMRTMAPAIATAFVLGIFLLLPVKPVILGDKKYLDYILQIVGILPGFYIAALAAAATFNNPSLDEPMPGKDAPHIDVQRGGEMFSVTMTMRVFICHLFSYLSALSFFTAVLTLIIIELAPSFEHWDKAYQSIAWGTISSVMQYGSVLIVTFYFARIILITLHGLYFLIERMHQANR